MARFRTLIAFGLASAMMIGAPAIAATQQHPATTPAAAKKAPHAPAKTRAATPARSRTHLAKATLRNSKQVTYDCRLAGNKNKHACKS